MKNISRETLFRRGVEDILRPYLFEFNVQANRQAICRGLTRFINDFFNSDIVVQDRTSPENVDKNSLDLRVVDTLSEHEYTLGEFFDCNIKNNSEDSK